MTQETLNLILVGLAVLLAAAAVVILALAVMLRRVDVRWGEYRRMEREAHEATEAWGDAQATLDLITSILDEHADTDPALAATKVRRALRVYRTDEPDSAATDTEEGISVVTTTNQDRLAGALTKNFGRPYAEVILLAARQHKALAATGPQLDAFNVQQISEHHAELRRLAGIHLAAKTVLRSVYPGKDVAWVERITDNHLHAMDDALCADHRSPRE